MGFKKSISIERIIMKNNSPQRTLPSLLPRSNQSLNAFFLEDISIFLNDMHALQFLDLSILDIIDFPLQ